MPKKIFTQADIEKQLEDAKVNRKRTGGFDEVSKRLEKIAQENANRNNPTENTDNDDLTVVDQVVVISNNENIETSVVLDKNREYYDQASYEKTFDTEVVQLKTKAPMPEEPIVPEPEPPPAPTDVRIRCLNHWWTMNGKKGRTEKEKPIL